MMCTQVFLVGQESECWLDIRMLTDCNMLHVHSQSNPWAKTKQSWQTVAKLLFLHDFLGWYFPPKQVSPTRR